MYVLGTYLLENVVIPVKPDMDVYMGRLEPILAFPGEMPPGAAPSLSWG